MIGAVGEPSQQAKQQKEEEDKAQDARLEHAITSHPDPNVRADSMMQVMKKHKVKPEIQGVLLKMLGVLGEGLKGAASFGAYPQIMEKRQEQERQQQFELQRQQTESGLRVQEKEAEIPLDVQRARAMLPVEVERAAQTTQAQEQVKERIAAQQRQELESKIATGKGRMEGESYDEFVDRTLAEYGMRGIRPPTPKETTIRNVIKPGEPGKFYTVVMDALTGRTIREEEQAPPPGWKGEATLMKGTPGEWEETLTSKWIFEHGGSQPTEKDRIAIKADASEQWLKNEVRKAQAQQLSLERGVVPEEFVNSMVQAVLDNRVAPTQLAEIFSRFGGNGNQGRQQVMARVFAQEPTFDMEAADAGYKFGSSQQTQQRVRLINSVRRAIPILKDLSARAKRRNLQIINWATIQTEMQLSRSDYVNLQGAAIAIQDEIGQIFQGGTGNATSDQKIALAGKLTNINLSPASFDDLLDTVNTLIEARRKSIIEGTFLERAPSPPVGATPGANPYR